jgi:hypothetical protein
MATFRSVRCPPGLGRCASRCPGCESAVVPSCACTRRSGPLGTAVEKSRGAAALALPASRRDEGGRRGLPGPLGARGIESDPSDTQAVATGRARSTDVVARPPPHGPTVCLWLGRRRGLRAPPCRSAPWSPHPYGRGCERPESPRARPQQAWPGARASLGPWRWRVGVVAGAPPCLCAAPWAMGLGAEDRQGVRHTAAGPITPPGALEGARPPAGRAGG